MLTLNTQIPTNVRGKVRALVKAHKHWQPFLIEQRLISADAKNYDLIKFALREPPLAARIEALINPRSAIDELALEIEALLREAGKRAAERYQAKRKAQNEAALNDFNYVGSRHHY